MRQRKKDHEEKKDGILQIAKEFVDLKLILLIKRDHVKKILDKSERTQKAADDTAEKGTEEEQDAQYVIREAELQSA